MKRLTFVFTVFILLISIFIIIIQEDKPENTAVAIIQKAFDATGANVASSEIYIRGKLKAEICETEVEQQQLISEIITGAGGDTALLKPVFSTIDNDSSFGIETDYIINNNNIHISILKDKQEGSAAEYQASISLTSTSQRPGIEKLAAGLTNTLERYKIDPDVNLCLTGSLNGELKDSELETICEKIFESAGADKVEGIRDNGLISVSAFSPSIKDAVRVNGKRVNLNVAVRYNSYEGKTYIWLATPVITTEY